MADSLFKLLYAGTEAAVTTFNGATNVYSGTTKSPAEFYVRNAAALGNVLPTTTGTLIGTWKSTDGYSATLQQNVVSISSTTGMKFADTDKIGYIVLDSNVSGGSKNGVAHVSFNKFNNNTRLVTNKLNSAVLTGASLVHLAGQNVDSKLTLVEGAVTVSDPKGNLKVYFRSSTNGADVPVLYQGASSGVEDNYESTVIIGSTKGGTINGGNGNDTLVAAPGSTATLVGGNGADVFLIGSSGNEAGTKDKDPVFTITDYSLSDGDKIQFVESDNSYSKASNVYAQYVLDSNGNTLGVNVGHAGESGVSQAVFIAQTNLTSINLNGKTTAIFNAGYTGAVENNVVTISDSDVKDGYSYYYTKGASTDNGLSVAIGSTMGSTTVKIKNAADQEKNMHIVGVNGGHVVGSIVGSTTITALDSDSISLTLSNVYSVSTVTESTGTVVGNFNGTTLMQQKIDASGTTKAINLLGSSSNNTILGGAGNNVIFTGTSSTNVISTGAGKDTVIAGSGSTNTITLGEGSDVIMFSGTSSANSISGTFNINEDRIALSSGLDNSTYTQIMTGSSAFFGSDGTFNALTNTVKLEGSGGFYAVAVGTSTATQAKVLFAGEGGNDIAASMVGATGNVIIIGDNNGETGNKLTGGTAADTILAGTNDTVVAGAGNDSIILGTSATNVYLSVGAGTGKDTIATFRNGFSSDADVLVLSDGSTINDLTSDVSIVGTSNIISYGTGSVQITQFTENSGENVNSGSADVKILASSGVFNTSFVTVSGGGTIGVTSSDTYSDIFYGVSGKTNAVDFANVDKAVIANLNNNLDYSEDNALYININQLSGSTKADNILVGATNKETLMGGNGVANTLIGGAGNDSLVGGSGDNASNIFYVGLGQGQDTLTNFGSTNSALAIVDGSGYTGATRSGSVVTIGFGEDKVVLDSVSADNKIDFFYTNSATEVAANGSTNSMKVGASGMTASVESGVNFYIYGGTNGTVAYHGDDASVVDLSGGNGENYLGYDRIVNDGNSASLLYGNGNNNYIANTGSGSATLWGGNGDDADTLVGGNAAADTFGYLLGNGKDTIVGANSDDMVLLLGMTDGDFVGETFANNTLTLNFRDGGSLTFSNYSTSSAPTVEYAGTKYTYGSSGWSVVS